MPSVFCVLRHMPFWTLPGCAVCQMPNSRHTLKSSQEVGQFALARLTLAWPPAASLPTDFTPKSSARRTTVLPKQCLKAAIGSHFCG